MSQLKDWVTDQLYALVGAQSVSTYARNLQFGRWLYKMQIKVPLTSACVLPCARLRGGRSCSLCHLACQEGKQCRGTRSTSAGRGWSASLQRHADFCIRAPCARAASRSSRQHISAAGEGSHQHRQEEQVLRPRRMAAHSTLDALRKVDCHTSWF
jgi:hypothetical protein